MQYLDTFDVIDRELAKKKMSRRELAKALNVPPSSLATAFARKSESFWRKDKRIDKVSEILNVPLYHLIFGAYNDGIYQNSLGDIGFSNITVSNLARHPEMIEILDDLLQDLSFRDVLFAIKNAKSADTLTEYRSALFSMHKYLQEVMDAWFYREVKVCPEDAPQTAADYNPGSDPMDAGNADSKPE